MERRITRHPHQYMEDAEDTDIKDAAIAVDAEREAVAADIARKTWRRLERSLRHQEVRPHTKAKTTIPTP